MCLSLQNQQDAPKCCWCLIVDVSGVCLCESTWRAFHGGSEGVICLWEPERMVLVWHLPEMASSLVFTFKARSFKSLIGRQTLGDNREQGSFVCVPRRQMHIFCCLVDIVTLSLYDFNCLSKSPGLHQDNDFLASSVVLGWNKKSKATGCFCVFGVVVFLMA